MKNNYYILILAILTLGFASCKKEFDSPPQNTIPTGYVLTMDSLINMYQGTPIHFTEDYSVYGVITADEVDGNLYKNIYVQNGTSALNLRLLNSGGVYIGDSIRIYLKGTVLSEYNGMLQLDSVDVDKNIIKQSTNVVVTPTDVNITDIDASWQSRLIKIDSVEFSSLELLTTYADAVNQTSENRTLTDCNGNTIIVRTSGYANYAGTQLAQGNGSLVAIVGVFGSTIQLYIRSLAEVQMTAPRCTGNAPFMFKDFEDNSITSGGWSIKNVSGSINWVTNGVGATSGSYYGQCSNYVSGTNYACDTWYISPSMDLSASVNPVLEFINAYNYSGAPLELYISTDYVSGMPSTGTWTQLTGWTISTGSWSWVTASINLSSYKQSNVHIGFRYTGTSSNGSTWEIDDIKVFDN